jgi:hypothetical protein
MKILRIIIYLSVSCTVMAVDPPACPGSWTMVHIPDTQNYVTTTQQAEILNRQITWISGQRAARNIRFVVQVGDLVNDNASAQWDRVRASFDKLGEVPFALCSGNHDCGPGGSGNTRETQFILQTRFGEGSPYQRQGTFRGWFQHPADPPGNTQNAWHTFRAGLQDYLVLTCEWGPRNKVVEWMDSIVASHPWHRIILVCHAYLATGSSRYDWAQSQTSMNPRGTGLASDPDGVNDGQDLWEKLVKKHGNFCLVCCGHAGRGFRTVTGINGNRVHEMLYNTQELANGGDGWLRLLEFYPDGSTVQARSYSTHLNAWEESSAGAFTFSLSPVSSVDSDQDGLPDYYEVQHGWNPDSPSDAGDDADHDGCSNLSEFMACTSPVDPGSALRIHSVTTTAGAGVALVWESVPGMKYQVQKSSLPASADWAAAGSVITATGFSTASTVNGTERRQFFRIAAVR